MYLLLNAAASTCPLGRVTPDSIFASKLMFYTGSAMMLAISAGIVIFALSILPKRLWTCPVSKLARATKIVVMYGEKEIVIPQGSKEFDVIIANLTEERKTADIEIASMKMYIYLKNTRYAAQVSMAGWNFLGEEKNSRAFLNNMQAMKAIDAAIDRSSKT